MHRRVGPRLRLLLGAVGLMAFVVMHGLTVPAGHLVSDISSAHRDTTMSSEPTVSATSANGSAHGMSGMAHGDVAQACLAAILSALVVVIAVRAATRRPGARQRRLLTIVSAPEPPVPRFTIAR